jgi:hypothetical protein
METPGTVPDSINCHACGAVIDLTGQTGFTHIECPHCEALSVVPLQFGNFLLLNPLGIGGVGTVYKAIDLSLNRYLALKILRKKLATNPEFIETFSREARAAAAVNHSNVAQVYSFGEYEGQYYLAMELLERGSLDDRILKQGKLPEVEVLQIGALIAAGLRAAYQRGLLHRDVKPGNILFNEDGVPKIVDFGLARVQTPSSTQKIAAEQAQAEPIWGTPYYVAPEKLRGQPEDIRSDIYSLGATLFHALAGRPPFEARTADEVVTKHATQPAFSLKTYAPTTHDYTAHVIARMLAKNPAERYETYDELIHDTQEAQAVLKAAGEARAIVAPSGERFSVSSILGTIAAMIVCGFVVWFVWTNRVAIFRMESAPPPAPSTPQAAQPGSPTASAEPDAVAGADEVDFTEDAPWVKAWNVAALQLAQGRYQDALIGYDNALQLVGRTRPKHRQWIFYFQGLTLQAADRPSESMAVFIKAVDPRFGAKVPETITMDNLAPVLAQMMLGALPVTDVEAAIPRMPPWAAAVASLSVGFKQVEAGRFSNAAESFRRYHKLPVDDRQRWAFNLQSLADKLARQCDSAARIMDEVDKLERDEKFGTALETLRAATTNTALTTLKTAFVARESSLERSSERQREQADRVQEEAARQRRESEEKERQQAVGEKKFLQAQESELSSLWQSYDFKVALAKYEAFAPKLQTAEMRNLLEQRKLTARLLVEFKSQLAGDFARRPYDHADLRTRNDTQLTGRLVRATDTQLVFATPYGEVVTDWRDLAPVTLVKLAEFYATSVAQTEKVELRARRYLGLAVFCKQYGLDRAAGAYVRQATELMPALKQEAEKVFGKAQS